MKRKNFFLFFYFPLIGVLAIFFILSSINRSFIKNRVENLINEQLYATAEILKANISYFLKEDFTPEDIFQFYSSEENIYYMALFDENKNILGWISRFEGYLPISRTDIGEKRSWLIDSPAGKIFNLNVPFELDGKQVYYLYLGYSLRGMEDMLAHSRLNFFIMFGVIAGIGILFFFSLYRLQSRYLEKEKEAEEEKREKERFREISAFTSGVAHEIKNPLNSLSLFCELLQKKVPAELQEDVVLSKKEVHKISRIIDLFSDIQRPLKLKKEKFDLEGLMKDVRSSLLSEFRETAKRIRYIQARPVLLFADKQLIGQAFFNLLKNSLEAETDGGVEIRASLNRNTVLIEFRDRGSGIPEQDREKIFLPFFSKKENGMGIGLYLVKKIFEAHGGKIDVLSEPGHGTTFLVQIPGGQHE